MAELGQTDDPKQLVPGDDGALTGIAASLRSRGDELAPAGKGLQRIDTSDGWSGPAADAFREKFHGQPGQWIEAGDSFHSAATAVETYARTLTWAQVQADEAIGQWNASQAATADAQTRYQQYRQAGGIDPFQDPGSAGRLSADAEPGPSAAQDRRGYRDDDGQASPGQGAQEARLLEQGRQLLLRCRRRPRERRWARAQRLGLVRQRDGAPPG
jgi:hypothetical protein